MDLLALADQFNREGNLSEAVDLYLQCFEATPDNTEINDRLWNLIQNYTLDEFLLEKIIKVYQNILQEQENLLFCYTVLGDALTKQNQIHEAVKVYQKANYINCLNLKPEYGHNYWALEEPHKPDFIIMGAQKCGTTSLYYYLNQHPQILQTFQKETRFFSWNWVESQAGKDWYLSHFPQLPQGESFLTGEASPDYFYFPDSEKRLFSMFPDTKLILLLRNPIDRSISDYYHSKRYGAEPRSLEEVLKIQTILLYKIANNEIVLSDQLLDEMQPNYFLNSVYIYFIEKWLSLFPRNQLLVLATEDLELKPKETMKVVYSFLGVCYHDIEEYFKHNSNSYPPISSSFRQTLYEHFQPFNKMLEEYLGCNPILYHRR